MYSGFADAEFFRGFANGRVVLYDVFSQLYGSLFYYAFHSSASQTNLIGYRYAAENQNMKATGKNPNVPSPISSLKTGWELKSARLYVITNKEGHHS